MNKKLIIGIGTGRCGTVSLNKVLNLQRGSNFTHESRPLLPWDFSEREITSKIRSLLNRKGKYVGETSFNYLTYVEYILSKWPKTKFVCLKRNKEETVKSYLKKTEGRNHWIIHDGKKWKKNREWDKCYPKFNVGSKEEALGKYWECYYKETDRLAREFPKNVKIWDIKKGLNTEKGIIEILNFAEISSRDQNISTNIQANKINISVWKRILHRLRFK